MTSLLQIIKRLQQLAPEDMTIQGNVSRVEVGPQTDTEQSNTTVSKVLVATYPSARVVTKASQDKVNLLVTYRPLFPFAVDRLTGLDLVRVRLLAKNYISTYAMGSGWLSARDGVTDAFVQALALEKIGEFTTESDYGQFAAIGRVCKLSTTMNHSGFANYVASKMGLNNIIFSGDFDDEVGDVLVIAGSVIDVPDIMKARKQDISTLITGELAPEVRLLAREEGMNMLELGAFVTENPGMKRLSDIIRLEFPDLKIDYIASNPLIHGIRPYKENMA